jgi:hypothetical protein
MTAATQLCQQAAAVLYAQQDHAKFCCISLPGIQVSGCDRAWPVCCVPPTLCSCTIRTTNCTRACAPLPPVARAPQGVEAVLTILHERHGFAQPGGVFLAAVDIMLEKEHVVAAVRAQLEQVAAGECCMLLRGACVELGVLCAARLLQTRPEHC